MVPRNNTAFSLLELLIVVGVISLLTVVSVPAISGLSQSRNLTNGGNMVISLAQQARQNSIAKNSLTALVLATQVSDTGFNLKLFCLMELAPGASQWTALSPWQILPTGVAVDSTQSGAFFNSPGVTPALQNPRFQGKDVSTVVYQIFSPDGSLYVGANGQPAIPPLVKLVPGIIAANGALQYTGAGGSSPDNYYEISLNLYTGVPQVQRQ